jgi:serine/threonine-protein kinase
MAQAPEVDPAAYRQYQRGVQIRKEQARIGRAREYFERAVAIDSSFALAWAWMAKMHAISGTTRTPAEELKAKAEEAVEKALALDSDLAEAYIALGLIREVLYIDGAGAEQAFKRALELEPGSQEALYEYGLLLMRMGRMDEALAALKRAQATDPLSMHVHFGLQKVYINSDQFEKAIQQAQRALKIERGHTAITSRLAWAYLHAGRFEEAEATYQRYEVLRGSWEYEGSFSEAYLHAKKGQPDKARAWIEAGGNPFGASWLYAALGEIELALDALDEADRTWPSRWSFIFLKILPPYDPLRGEPRFQALMEKTSLA